MELNLSSGQLYLLTNMQVRGISLIDPISILSVGPGLGGESNPTLTHPEACWCVQTSVEILSQVAHHRAEVSPTSLDPSVSGGLVAALGSLAAVQLELRTHWQLVGNFSNDVQAPWTSV